MPEHSFTCKQGATSDSSVVSKHPAVSGTLVGTHSTNICAVHDCLQPSEINLSKNLYKPNYYSLPLSTAAWVERAKQS